MPQLFLKAPSGIDLSAYSNESTLHHLPRINPPLETRFWPPKAPLMGMSFFSRPKIVAIVWLFQAQHSYCPMVFFPLIKNLRLRQTTLSSNNPDHRTKYLITPYVTSISNHLNNFNFRVLLFIKPQFFFHLYLSIFNVPLTPGHSFHN
jgi:hypothetical protein